MAKAKTTKKKQGGIAGKPLIMRRTEGDIELSMIGELRESILKADAELDGEKMSELMHVLEHLQTPEVREIKYALFREMIYRKMYLAGFTRCGA